MDMSIRFPGLNLILDYVPESFSIFGFEITIYGILVALGMMLGISFVVLEAKRNHENPDRYLDLAIVSLITGVIGARLSYVAFSWSLYKNDYMQIFNTRAGGMIFYGGLLGGVLGAAVYCLIRKLSFWQMADISCMGVLIGQIIGRWGNFFSRESFGEYTDNVLSMQLPLTAVRAGEVTSGMRDSLQNIDGVSYIQVQPAFLYESLWCLFLFILLLVWLRKKKFQGEIFLRYLAGYGLGRFFIEWMRTDKVVFPGTHIAVSQIISAVLFVVCFVVVVVKRIMARKRDAARRRRRERDYEAEENRKKEEDADSRAVDAILEELTGTYDESRKSLREQEDDPKKAKGNSGQPEEQEVLEEKMPAAQADDGEIQEEIPAGGDTVPAEDPEQKDKLRE